ncbi:hypothetical protein [Polymorphobacter sp.]|uniref:hypothetical protein n=1 Tax=Polymorphobacter sp. TaxID=1909290 RepID=UPI003F6E5969
MAFSFDVPSPASADGDLAGFSQQLSASVARMLCEDKRNRREIAKAMSRLLAEEVTPAMIDAYASEARIGHNIPAARWWALVAVTGRFDVADAIAAQTGARVISGEEIRATELGHIQAQMDELRERERSLKAVRPVVRRAR